MKSFKNYIREAMKEDISGTETGLGSGVRPGTGTGSSLKKQIFQLQYQQDRKTLLSKNLPSDMFQPSNQPSNQPLNKQSNQPSNQPSNKKQDPKKGIAMRSKNLPSDMFQPSNQQSKKEQEIQDAAARAEWEKNNPYEAKVFAERERLANESSAKRKQEWEKQQAERRQWWSNPQNERKAIEWDAKNPRPESGYAFDQWQKKRAEAGIMDREQKEFIDISYNKLSKPWKPEPMPYKPPPIN